MQEAIFTSAILRVRRAHFLVYVNAIRLVGLAAILLIGVNATNLAGGVDRRHRHRRRAGHRSHRNRRFSAWARSVNSNAAGNRKLRFDRRNYLPILNLVARELLRPEPHMRHVQCDSAT